MHALARITAYTSVSKKIILLNKFSKCRFSYSLLAWICQSQTLTNKINTLHERCFPIIYNDKQSQFQELLD